MRENRVQFRGFGPFALPPLKAAKVHILEDVVEVLLVGTIRNKPEAMIAKLDRTVAADLSSQLSEALAKLSKE